MPHCGIVAGPGRGTRILRNRTTDTMQVLADGGGIYLSGAQGESHDSGAVVRGNVIEGTRTPYNFGLHLAGLDGKFPALSDEILAEAGIKTVLTGIRRPRMNAPTKGRRTSLPGRLSSSGGAYFAIDRVPTGPSI